ncbi:MarR family winged helix-turn-helix transcriptional regulator [Streptomyces sp. NPDC091272]|uniref:MarR family winged helix-turn-helix transcriptional regulator n=1 Tax=Streptomyces sp. NPDC091272 TaxID=3365981 RepID=UPI0038174449
MSDIAETRPARPEEQLSPDTRADDGMLAEQLLRLTRRLHRAQKRQLEPIGITPGQARLLRVVARLSLPEGADGAAPRMTDLAHSLEVVPRAVTTLVDALEEQGRVRRVPDPASRRVIRIELTDTGRTTLGDLRNARRDAVEDILAPLTAAQRKQLGGLISTLIDGGTHPC